MHFAYWGKVVLFFQSDKCCCLVSVSQPSQGPCGVQGHLGWASNSHPTPTDAPGRQQGAVCVLKSPLFTWEPQVEFQLPAAVAQPSPWELTVDREICPLPAHSECVQGGGSSPHGFFLCLGHLLGGPGPCLPSGWPVLLPVPSRVLWLRAGGPRPCGRVHRVHAGFLCLLLQNLDRGLGFLCQGREYNHRRLDTSLSLAEGS